MLRRFFWAMLGLRIPVPMTDQERADYIAHCYADPEVVNEPGVRLYDMLPESQRHRCGLGGDLYPVASKGVPYPCQWCGGPEPCPDHAGWPS